MRMLLILLSIGALNALIPLLIILILIAAATGITRGWNIFALFGISTLIGMGATGKGTLRGKSMSQSTRKLYGKKGLAGTDISKKYGEKIAAKVKTKVYMKAANTLERMSEKSGSKGHTIRSNVLGKASSMVGAHAYKVASKKGSDKKELNTKDKIRMEAEVLGGQMAAQKGTGKVRMSVRGVEKIMNKNAVRGKPSITPAPARGKLKKVIGSGASTSNYANYLRRTTLKQEAAMNQLIANVAAHGGKATKQDLKNFYKSMPNESNNAYFIYKSKQVGNKAINAARNPSSSINSAMQKIKTGTVVAGYAGKKTLSGAASLAGKGEFGEIVKNERYATIYAAKANKLEEKANKAHNPIVKQKYTQASQNYKNLTNYHLNEFDQAVNKFTSSGSAPKEVNNIMQKYAQKRKKEIQDTL